MQPLVEQPMQLSGQGDSYPETPPINQLRRCHFYSNQKNPVADRQHG
jgi:hypothetical protein